jgi:hypothetical protein
MKLKESSLRSWFSRWGYEKPAPAPKAVTKTVKEAKPKSTTKAKPEGGAAVTAA